MRPTTLATRSVLACFALLTAGPALHGQSATAVADSAVSIAFQDSGPATADQGVSISFAESGGAVAAHGVSISFQSGGINVTTNLTSASFTITGPAVYTGTGTAFIQPNAPPGQYTISFGAVSGYTTPTQQTQNLAVGGSVYFTGTYSSVLPPLAVSPTTLAFSYQQGFVGPPSPQTVTVSSGANALSFTAAATTTPPGGTWLSASPTSGTTPASLAASVAGGLTAGTYSGQITVTAPGTGNSPLAVPVSLTVAPPGPSTGTINVTTNLPDATFTLTGRTTYTGNGTSATFSNAPVGQYTVTFGPVAGYTVSFPQTQQLVGDGTITFNGNYTAPPAVLVVPGIFGTKLGNTTEVVWISIQSIQQQVLGRPVGNSYFLDLAYNAQGQPVDSTLSPAAIGPDGKNYGGLFDLYSDRADLSYRLDCNIPEVEVLDWWNNADTCNQSIYVYNAPPGQTGGLIPSLQGAGYTVSTFPYDWRGDITPLADILAKRIVALAKQTPSGTVAIVAHSMGGLLVGEALYRHGTELNGVIQSITTLGTPWLGSTEAYFYFRAWDSMLAPILTPQQTQAIGENWTAAYELLPQQPFVSLIAGTPTVQETYDGTFSSYLPALPRAVGAGNALDTAVTLWGNLAAITPLTNTFTIVGSGYNTPTTIVEPELNAGCLIEVYGNGDGTVTTGSATGGVWPTQGNTWYVLSDHAGLPANSVAIGAIEEILQGQVPNLSLAPFQAPGGSGTTCLPM